MAASGMNVLLRGIGKGYCRTSVAVRTSHRRRRSQAPRALRVIAASSRVGRPWSKTRRESKDVRPGALLLVTLEGLRGAEIERVHMSYYRHHIFFCCNQRPAGQRRCCNNNMATEMREYCKSRVKQLGLAKPDGIRVNMAGCMERCDTGPVCVVYPEAVWYRYGNAKDIDEIVDVHLVQGRIVDRLKI